MLSVIIPARREKYLEKTIRNVLENARGNIEILAMLDGWLPEPQLVLNDERVKFFHFEESIGQRQCINYAAKQAKGKYVMKLDAHCAVDEGFDVKLAADCKYDWTVIPRMYNLDIETWKPKKHKLTDYMHMGFNDKNELRALYYTGDEYRRQHREKTEIDEIMCCMGPCFFMHKDRFWELEGCDEGHGSWGQQGVEVSCKAWLSGGKLMVNKKTWFSHWFRGGSGPGFPYELSGRAVKEARSYSKDLWLNDRWPLQARKFQWLVDKFNAPNGERKVEVYRPRRAKSHVHGRGVSVENLIENLEHYWDYRRKSRAEGFIKTAIPFFRELKSGKTFTTEDLKAHPYYQYVADGFKTDSPNKVMRIVRDSVDLFHNIKERGLRCPIEMWEENGKYNISRGTRRVAILYVLGTRWVAARMYKNRDFMEKLRPQKDTLGVISLVAQKQFSQWGWKATDKYWLHDYTPHYDRHCGYLQSEAQKVLEIGVKRGGSIRLWHEVFSKAHIYGVDIDLKAATLTKGVDRITLLEGSQVDEEFNHNVVSPHGPFDLIVDDASHRPEHQIKGFDLLWPSVKPGGWYVIEDLYYRNYYRNKGTENMISKLRSIIDDLNEKCELNAIHLYYNICFFQKRKKRET